MIALASLLVSLAPALPQDDEQPRGLLRYEGDTFDGYTLVAPLQSDRVHLIDMEGEVVHEWAADRGGDGGNYLLENGDLLRSGLEPDNPRFDSGGIGGRIQRYDWDGERVWTFVFSDDQRCHHHDVELLPNGNLLAVAWEYRDEETAIAHGRDPAHVGERGMWPDMVIEIRPILPDGGEIVWEWHAFDHLVQDFDAEAAHYGSPYDHPERIDINADHRDQPPISAEEMKAQAELEAQMRALGYLEDKAEATPAPGGRRPSPDWMHTNAVAHHPELDLIVLSVPNMNEVWVIDHSTTTEEARGSTGGRYGKGGDLLYRWGNPRNYGHGGPEDQRLFFQHNPTWLEGEDGAVHLLIFNNRGGAEGERGRRSSSVIELRLPFTAEAGFEREDGTAFGPLEPAWSYVADAAHSSGFISGSQRLANGNTLICAGAPGRIFEVSPEGEILWDYVNPNGTRPEGSRGGPSPTAVFRALRYHYDDPRFEGRF